MLARQKLPHQLAKSRLERGLHARIMSDDGLRMRRLSWRLRHLWLMQPVNYGLRINEANTLHVPAAAIFSLLVS
jgi:hypothetical protein